MPKSDKRVRWNYDDILARSEETECYELSERDIHVLLNILPHASWRTRWQGDNVDMHTVDEIVLQTVNRLLTPPNETECGSDDTGYCLRFDTNSDTYTIYPNDPWRPDLGITPTFTQARWYTVEEFIDSAQPNVGSLIYASLLQFGGYFPDDFFVICGQEVQNPFTDFNQWFSQFTNFPAPYIHIDLQGSGRFEIEILNVPIGGYCLIVPDGQNILATVTNAFQNFIDNGTQLPDKWLFFETNRAFGETSASFIQPVEFPDDAPHTIDVFWFPRLDVTQPPFIFPAGGWRNFEACGNLDVISVTGTAYTRENYGLSVRSTQRDIGRLYEVEMITLFGGNETTASNAVDTMDKFTHSQVLDAGNYIITFYGNVRVRQQNDACFVRLKINSTILQEFEIPAQVSQEEVVIVMSAGVRIVQSGTQFLRIETTDLLSSDSGMPAFYKIEKAVDVDALTVTPAVTVTPNASGRLVEFDMNADGIPEASTQIDDGQPAPVPQIQITDNQAGALLEFDMNADSVFEASVQINDGQDGQDGQDGGGSSPTFEPLLLDVNYPNISIIHGNVVNGNIESVLSGNFGRIVADFPIPQDLYVTGVLIDVSCGDETFIQLDFSNSSAAALFRKNDVANGFDGILTDADSQKEPSVLPNLYRPSTNGFLRLTMRTTTLPSGTNLFRRAILLGKAL